MTHIKIPSIGESVTEATLAEWFKRDGQYVQQDEPVLSLETEKASVEVVAETSGILKILVPQGETVKVGTIVSRANTPS